MQGTVSKPRIFHKFRYFESAGEVFLLVQIVMLWSILPFLLLLPFKHVLRILTPVRKNHLIVPQNSRKRQKIIFFTNYWVTRKVVSAYNTCLKQSLVRYYFLNREGFPTRICLGVRKVNGNLTGHSWIETAEIPARNYESHHDFVKIYSSPM